MIIRYSINSTSLESANFKIKPQSQNVAINSSAKFFCAAENDSDQSCKVTWTANGRPLNEYLMLKNAKNDVNSRKNRRIKLDEQVTQENVSKI